MQVDTNVDEADIGRVVLAQTADFTVDAYPNRTFRGQVREIRKAPNNVQNVITYDVVVAADNSDLKLFPGMTANVRVLTDHRDAVLKVPNAALRFRPALERTAPTTVHAAGRTKTDGMQTIWVQDSSGKPRPVRVKLGITDGTYSEVVQGKLQPGDPVIVGTEGATASTSRSSQPGAGASRRGPGF